MCVCVCVREGGSVSFHSPLVARLTGAMPHCKQVLVQWVPAQRGDSHLACSVKLEPPERKKRTLVFPILICTILIVLEVCVGGREERGREERGRRDKGRREGGGTEGGRREGGGMKGGGREERGGRVGKERQ